MHDLRTGRYWRCSDLRNKSFEDLHKLWFVLLKERNMLLTYEHFSRLQTGKFTHPERKWKVKRSMANIKVVLGERYREFRFRTEPPNSLWRQAIEAHRKKKRDLRHKKQKIKHPKKQVIRRNMFSPLRKKFAFRNLKPRVTTTEPTVQS
jgi:large subunit ribosomal protein L47